MIKSAKSLGFLTGLCLLPWLIIQPQLEISGDAAWYINAMRLLLAGGKMGDAYFDASPPLTSLIYLPAALLTHAGVSAWDALSLWMVALAGLSLFLLHGLLKGSPHLGEGRICGLMAVFATVTLLVTPQEFGHKDQMITLLLLPFLLAQFALTYDLAVPRWIVRTSLIAGAPFILVKPHYGLLPSLMLLHRCLRERRLSIVFDFDFLALAAGVLLYAAVTVVWFPEFFKIILPYGLRFYVGAPRLHAVMLRAGLAAILAVGLATTALLAEGKRGREREITFFNSMAIACTIPFLAQMKGYNEHMAELAMLTACAGFLNASCLLKSMPLVRSGIAALVAILLVFGGGYYVFLKRMPPTGVVIAQSPFANFIRTNATGSSFFVQESEMTIYMPVSLYTGIPHASRFDTFWFLPFPETLEKQERKHAVDFFGGAIATDFVRYKPVLVLLPHKPEPGLDMLAVFGGNPAFRKEWKNYRPGGHIEIDAAKYEMRRKHAPFLVAYDIYKRTDENR